MVQVKVIGFVTSCSVVVGYHCFGGPCCLQLQGEMVGDEKGDIDIGIGVRVQQPIGNRKKIMILAARRE
jgi:hypothetical protein